MKLNKFKLDCMWYYSKWKKKILFFYILSAAAVQTSQTSQGPAPADMQRAYAALGLPFNAGNGSANINPVIQRNQTVSAPHGKLLLIWTTIH